MKSNESSKQPCSLCFASQAGRSPGMRCHTRDVYGRIEVEPS